MVRRVQQLPVVAAPLIRRFGLMAEALRFETNDERLMAAAQASFSRFPVPPDDGREPLVVRLVHDDVAIGAVTAANAPVPGRLVYRAQRDLVLITHGTADVASIDTRLGVAIGVVGPSTAADPAFVRYAFVEAMALAMLSRSRGYLTLHASGIVRDGVGIALLGPAGSGKSTLALAAARRGYGVFAEDAVFVHAGAARLELWGMPWTQRLLPDAPRLFPELAGEAPRVQPNGEAKLELDLDRLLPGRAVPCAPAGAVVALVRGTGEATRLEVLPAGEAESAIEVLWPYDGGWTERHESLAARLAALPVLRLHNDTSPDEAVDELDRLVERLRA